MKSSFFILSLLVALASCNAKKPTPPKDLTLILPSEPPHLDPQLADTGASVFLLRQITTTLFDYDTQMKIQPKAADSYSWVNNGLTLEVRVKENLSWSDGSPLLACEFKDGIVRALNHETPSSLADLFFEIKNARGFKQKSAKESDLGISCDNTQRLLRFEVLRPFSPQTLHSLAYVISSPIKAELVKTLGSRWMLPQESGRKGISSGAYIVTAWNSGEKIELEPRESANLKVKALFVAEPQTALTLYEQNVADILLELPPLLLPKLKLRPDFKTYPYLTTYMIGFGFETGSGKTLSTAQRQALILSARSEEIPSLLQGGESHGQSWVPPELLPANIQKVSALNFDSKRAKALFQKPAFTPELWFNAGERHKLVVERLANNWKRYLDLDISLQPIEWKALVHQLKKAAPTLYRYAWTAVYPDARFFISLFHSQNENNFGRWKNAEYDKLCEEILSTPIEKEDDAYWSKVQRAQQILLWEDPALFPVYHYTKNLLVKKNLDGFEMNPQGFVDFSKIRRPN